MILKNMFADDIATCSKATLPIVTKCREAEAEDNDLDILRHDASEILEAELNVER